jgi:hypothetical protein
MNKIICVCLLIFKLNYNNIMDQTLDQSKTPIGPTGPAGPSEQRLNMAQLQESIKVINLSLNKSCKSGTFTLEEAHLIKVCMNNIETAIDFLTKK